MTGVPKPSPTEAFESNMADAHQLVKLVEGLRNKRVRRMRRELREQVGIALKIPARQQGELDCLESDDAFLTFLPNSRLCREDFSDMRPLLRQAIVAGCAATETYVADKVMDHIGPVLRSNRPLPSRLAQLPLTVGQWLDIESYDRRRRGLREIVVAPYVRIQSSTAPGQVGILLSFVGLADWAKKVDQTRKVAKGDTVASLERITARRNRIAHEGDRSGRGRANIEVEEVHCDLAILESIVHAIDRLNFQI